MNIFFRIHYHTSKIKEEMLSFPSVYNTLQFAGGVDTASTDGTYDVSNSDRLGCSEVSQVQFVVTGVNLLIEMEKRLEKGESIDDLIPKEKVTF